MLVNVNVNHQLCHCSVVHVLTPLLPAISCVLYDGGRQETTDFHNLFTI